MTHFLIIATLGKRGAIFHTSFYGLSFFPWTVPKGMFTETPVMYRLGFLFIMFIWLAGN